MGSLAARILGAVGAAVLSVMMFGSGVASADLVGLTYDEAAEWISSRNGTPVVGTVSGDQLDTGDCVVVSWQTLSSLPQPQALLPPSSKENGCSMYASPLSAMRLHRIVEPSTEMDAPHETRPTRALFSMSDDDTVSAAGARMDITSTPSPNNPS